MSKFLEGRVLNFVSDEVYKRLPQDIKETKKLYHRRHDLVRRKLKKIENLKRKVQTEMDLLKELKNDLVDMKPKVDTFLKNFKISISLSSYKKKYVPKNTYGHLRLDKTKDTERYYNCYLDRVGYTTKSIYLGSEKTLKKYLLRRYEGNDKVIRKVNKDVLGFVNEIIYGQDLYDRMMIRIIENPTTDRKVWKGMKFNRDDIFFVNKGVSIPIMITNKMRMDLLTLGWSRDEMKHLTPKECWELIQKGEPKKPSRDRSRNQ